MRYAHAIPVTHAFAIWSLQQGCVMQSPFNRQPFRYRERAVAVVLGKLLRQPVIFLSVIDQISTVGFVLQVRREVE